MRNRRKNEKIEYLFYTSSGFTLIEFLVAFSIFAVVGSIGISSYNNFNNTQRAKQAALTLKNNLRNAQTKASVALKPPGCDPLDGYEVAFTDTDYHIHPVCNGIDSTPDVEYGLSSQELYFSTYPAAILFGVLTQGVVAGSGNIVVSSYISDVPSFTLRLSSSGEITGPY